MRAARDADATVIAVHHCSESLVTQLLEESWVRRGYLISDLTCSHDNLLLLVSLRARLRSIARINHSKSHSGLSMVVVALGMAHRDLELAAIRADHQPTQQQLQVMCSYLTRSCVLSLDSIGPTAKSEFKQQGRETSSDSNLVWPARDDSPTAAIHTVDTRALACGTLVRFS